MRAIDIEWIKSWAVTVQIETYQDRLLELAYRTPPENRVIVEIESVINPELLVLLAHRIVWTNASVGIPIWFLVRKFLVQHKS